MGWEIIMPIVAGGARSFFGYLTNALKDGKLDKYEIGKLFGTIIEVGLMSVALMYGLNMDASSAAGIGVLASFLISGVKKAGINA